MMKRWAKSAWASLVDFGLPAFLLVAFERAPDGIKYVQLVLGFVVLRQVNAIREKLG